MLLFGAYALIWGGLHWREFGNSVAGPTGDWIMMLAFVLLTVAGFLLALTQGRPWIKP